MDARRLLTKVSFGLLGAAVIVTGTPTAVYAAAPAAPASFTVARAADDVKKINVGWKPVAGAHHYVVESVAGNVETVVNVPSTTQSYTVDAPDVCSNYKVRVGAADAAGNTSSTAYWTLKSLAPTYVGGVVNGREDNGTTVTESWTAPSWGGYTPLTGYHVVFTRISDGVVLVDKTTTDTTFRYENADPARVYTLAVTPANQFGECATAKSTIDRYRPGDPTGLVLQRRADAASTVELVWQPAPSGPAPTYYLVSYGTDKITKSLRVDAPATSATLTLDSTKSWMIEVKAYNAIGGSNAVTGTVPVWVPTTTPAPTPPTTQPTPPVTPTDPAPSAPAPTDPATPGTPATEPSDESTTTTTTVNTGNDRTPPTITATLSAAPKNGWFRTPVTIHFTCADSGSSIATCPADLLADKDGTSQRFSGTAADAAGNTATVTTALSIDQTPPVVVTNVSGTKGTDGWYTSAPSITFTCTDTVSGSNTVSVCPTGTAITKDGANQKVTGTAWDKAGNSATDTVTISVDRVAPVITATVTGDTNADGWYTTAPTVHFTCTDTGSGVANCPEDRKVTKDDVSQEITGTVVDKAGNSASTSVTLSVDQTAPSIVAEVIGAASEDGWYKSTPTVHFTCNDSGSGIATCPADVTVNGEGADQAVTGTSVDRAGNTSTTTVLVDVDRTAPVITATVVGDANADGWYTTKPIVHFTCTDAGAGIAVCPEDTEVTTDGKAQTLSGIAVDRAGNTAETSVTLNADLTAPEITATVLGDANADGWHRTAPTVHFTCTDAGSGIATCPADAPVDLDSTGKVVTGSAVDKAGHSSTASVTLNVDKTAPAITATVVQAPNAGGWHRTAPTVHFTCTDLGSGIATCPADTTVTTNGAAQKISGTAVDKAGNTAAATVSVNVDLVAPEIAATVDGTKNAAGWYRTAPTVRYACTDTVSAVASCPAAKAVTTEGTALSVAGTGSDKAGNGTTSTLALNVDKTAPVVSVAGVTNGARYGAEGVPSATCRTADQVSGVATEATATTSNNDLGVHTVVCAGGVDKAGNAAAPVSVSYTVQASDAWLLKLTREYLGTGQESALKDFEAALAKGNYSNYRAKVIVNSVGKNPPLSPGEAATLLYWSVVLDLRS
ncbi:Neogenin [Actinoplanes sp. NPDC049668]|uniref:Neogenin n=1 Tax=unclassified Actinoplanes TaxID=2626549 RepID=UPI0033AEB572